MITRLKRFGRPLASCRLLTTSGQTAHVPKNAFPYPEHRNPTPHQIFHLPRNSSAEEIKARYFELVRIYHPDSPLSRSSRIPSEKIRLRFHSITAAYARLLGKAGADAHGPGVAHDRAASWRANKIRRYEFLEGGGLDERWKEWVLVGAVVFTAIAFVAQVAWTRRQALAEISATRRQRSDLVLKVQEPLGASSLNVTNDQ